MNRLQQKCAIASTGVHLLLFSVLLVGPAFMASKSKPDDLPILDFIPLKTTDDMVSGGGNPNGRLPEAAPPPAPPKPPAPAPQPQEKAAPETPKPVEREVVKESTESSLVPSTDKKPKKPEVSTKMVTRKRSTSTEDTSAQEEREAKEAADRRRRMANLLGNAAGHIESGLSSGISTKDLLGPGGGGVPYANFYQTVKTVYARAWTIPDGISDDDATVDASVTIARDGKVVSWRVLRASGNVGVDQSVRMTLERVKFVAPLPDGAKEDERTVPITFSVRAKRLLG